MSAGISLMYRDSGGCDYKHECRECWYFSAETAGKIVHYFCHAHPYDGGDWKPDYVACQTFLPNEKEVVIKEEAGGQYKLF